MVVVKEDSEDESLRIDCPVLVTERLVLRPPHEDDVPDLARLANNRRIAEMLARMPHPYGVREGRAFVGMASVRQGAGCVYAVTIAESGAFVGCAGLNGTERGLELGYWIGEPWWGHGYATEAAQALLDVAFGAMGLHRVRAELDPRNTASVALCRRLGMREEAHHVRDFRDERIPGGWGDTGVWAILADEWTVRP